jgi:hypothetical protein
MSFLNQNTPIIMGKPIDVFNSTGNSMRYAVEIVGHLISPPHHHSLYKYPGNGAGGYSSYPSYNNSNGSSSNFYGSKCERSYYSSSPR